MNVISIYNGFILSHNFLNILVLLVGTFWNVDHPMVAPFQLMCNWKIDGLSLVDMVGVTTFYPFLYTFLLVGFIEILVLHWYKISCILKLIFVKSLALLHVCVCIRNMSILYKSFLGIWDHLLYKFLQSKLVKASY